MDSTYPDRITLGISSCLLGERVRFDANHKLDSYITGTLARYFQFVPVCPEVAIGLGVPRGPIRLEGDPARPRAVGVRNKALEVTAPLEAYGRRMGRELPAISGYILKSKSPSCGMERVKVYGGAVAAKRGRGLFARELMAARPLLPVEEEGRLGDPELRDNFLERVFAYRRWQELEAQGITAARLVQFHAAHKLILMAHSTEHNRALGRLVADAGRHEAPALAAQYAQGFMAALALKATPRKHANVLQHLTGYLKQRLDAGDKAELREIIDHYRTERLPLIVPLTVLRHHFRRHPHAYVEQQFYLYPADAEVRLRFG